MITDKSYPPRIPVVIVCTLYSK